MISDIEQELSARQQREIHETEQMFTVVAPDSEEYRMVADKFRESTDDHIVRIEKINNPTLHQQYAAAVAVSGSGTAGWYFHGSPNHNYVSIARNGFDIGKSQNGLLGVGVYFAEQSSYSRCYTGMFKGEDGSGGSSIYNMLMCRVYRLPSDRDSSKIICISNDRRAYPQYIVYAQRNI